MKFPDVRITGVGETPKSRAREDRGEEYHNVEEYFARATVETLEDAGVDKEDVDGLGIIEPLAAPTPIIYPSALAEFLGFTGLKWLVVADHGGTSALELLLQGGMAVQSGRVENLLCLGADTHHHPDEDDDVIPPTERGFSRNHMDPYGAQGPSSHIAMVQQRHMEKYGTTLEQIGEIPVTQRFHASKNSLAYLDDPIDFEEYRDSPPIADPVRLLDCVIPVNGGYGALLSNRNSPAGERATPSVRIEGFGQCMSNAEPVETSDLTVTGMVEAGREAFEQASMGPEDLDGLQLYDDYPIMVLIQLEDLGFCEKGEGGPFVRSRSLRYDGDLPLNTAGGQLSAGQSGTAGGFIGLLEAVRQLRGTAQERQIPRAETCLVTGLGGISYDRNLQNTNAAILSNREQIE